MKKQVHKNYIIASNMIYASVGLGMIGDYFSVGDLFSGEFLASTFITVLLFVPIAYFIRKGSQVAVYIFLFLTVLALIVTYFIYLEIIKEPLISKLIFIVDWVLEIWALVFVFMVPKEAAGSEAIDEGV